MGDEILDAAQRALQHQKLNLFVERLPDYDDTLTIAIAKGKGRMKGIYAELELTPDEYESLVEYFTEALEDYGRFDGLPRC